MSLFPAYSGTETEQAESTSKPTSWIENNSFQGNDKLIKDVTTAVTIVVHSSSSSSSSNSTDSDVEIVDSKKKKYSKKKSRKCPENDRPPEKTLEFDGNEEYYVDKKAIPSYKSITTLHRPACPRYHRNYTYNLDWNGMKYGSTPGKYSKSLKRYFRELKRSKVQDSDASMEALNENEYTLRLGQLNRKVMEAPATLQNWLDLISVQEKNPYKWSRLFLAEKKIDIIKRAMVYHPRNDALYRIFVNTICDTYPSFEVSKLLDGLLNKDPYSYTLWTAQIMTTQGSMARCIVPDVLLIYERCMQKMHHKQKQQETMETFDSDVIMLKLFNNCALFLRQAGLYEQFFALIKLALDLNVSIEQFGCFTTPNDNDQRTLIEYEEMILQSGLPMNEIWLRIEKLRQSFNFIPCPINSKCSDPQRIVFNEDVCHYIYPMKNMDNSFYLILLILRLLKLPFVQSDRLAAKFSARVDAIGDSDAIEEMLAIGLCPTYATCQSLQQQQEEFFNSLYDLAREMVVTPTFLSSSIGCEIYVKCITELLQSASSAYAGIDERRRIIFLLLLCRFERLQLILEKAAKKLTPQFIKNGRGRFKALLKQSANRSCLILYTEFALYEFEALEQNASLDTVRNTFESIISTIDEGCANDLANAYVKYAEILLGRGMREEAMQVLASCVLKTDIKNNLSEPRKLSALKQIIDKVDSIIEIERNVEIMVLEQYFLPDQTIIFLKIRILLQYLIGQKLEALAYLDKLLKVFVDQTDRHQVLREYIYEIYVTLAQLPASNCIVSNTALSSRLFEAIKEFPRNLYFLQTCGMLGLPWYRIRTAMLGDTPNIVSITFLIVSARSRFLAMLKSSTEIEALIPTNVPREFDQKHNESLVRNRILSVFQILTSLHASNSDPKLALKALRRNSLFWRFYLRCLSDQNTAFETSKKCLLTSLDDCPWSKALYMDGATYVPQELSHLQDLMIEKQLRMYALPEELEILRER